MSEAKTIEATKAAINLLKATVHACQAVLAELREELRKLELEQAWRDEKKRAEVGEVAVNPRPGDRWYSNGELICLVYEVTDKTVTLGFDQGGTNDLEHTQWTRGYFAHRMRWRQHAHIVRRPTEAPP